MKKLIFAFSLIFFAAALYASCLGERAFTHTYEYMVFASNANSGHKCQAVKIKENWFLTSAHCVAQDCKTACNIEMELLPYNPGATALIEHRPGKKKVFFPPDFSYDSATASANDIALINLNPDKYFFYDRVVKAPISPEMFNMIISKDKRVSDEWKEALYGKAKHRFVFADNNPYKLETGFSAIELSQGNRSAFCVKSPYYYVPQRGVGYVKNMIRDKGLSGSGVLTSNGDLLGIISSTIGNGEYYLITPFNAQNINFITSITGSVPQVNIKNTGGKISEEDQSWFINSIDSTASAHRK